MGTLNDRQIRTMTMALRDFGYAFIGEEEVRQAAERVLAGEKPSSIIAMFVEGWLKEAGFIK